MTNILVPTDFSFQSLEIVDQIVRIQQKPVKIFLLHMVHLPTDISELLFLKKTNLQRHVPNEFSQAMHALKDKYPEQLSGIELKLHYGTHSAVFNGITDNLRIDEIYLLNDYSYTLPLPDSANMIRMINRSDIPVYRIASRKKQKNVAETNLLTSFFRSENYSTVS